MLKGLAEQEVADQHARLVAPQHARRQFAAPQFAFIDHIVVQQRRRMHEFDRGRELDMAVAGIAGELAIANVSIGRSRLPPELIKWLATSGIMVTSEPVRDRIVALTRSMSAATRSTNWSIEAPEGLSKGTITATPASTFAQSALSLDITIESAA